MSGYLLFKSLHLIAVISWMAGLLYLPRIFVYHVENSEKDQVTQIFETMERKLYNYIMRPAMLLSWFFGIILIWINGIESFTFLWLQLKILLVVLLTIYHEYLGRCMRLLKSKENQLLPIKGKRSVSEKILFKRFLISLCKYRFNGTLKSLNLVSL